ncbi:MAG UNVERIFIED_CONTAM: hypothetical protein LVR18_02395 [Planctomycetaceae bacterium]
MAAGGVAGAGAAAVFGAAATVAAGVVLAESCGSWLTSSESIKAIADIVKTSKIMAWTVVFEA